MNSSRIKQLYQELVIDHNKNPRNFREIPDTTHHAKGHNPLCGDKIDIFLILDSNNIITDVSFTGDGCAISKSSASLMTTAIKGKSVEEAELLFNEFHQMSMGQLDINNSEHHLGKLTVFSGVRDLPARVKCATLPWHTLHAALQNEKIISTE